MTTHTGRGATAGRQHKFFKVLLPGFFEISLCIPPKFVAGLACRQRRATATLRDPAGRPWNVDMDRDHENRTCFTGRGWRGFVSGNGVSAGQMLVFEHRGGLDFAVDMFDPSGCLSDDKDVKASPRDNGCHKVTELIEITGDEESGNDRRRAEAEAVGVAAKRRRKLQASSSSCTATTTGDDETLLCQRIEKPYQLRFLDVKKSLCERLGWTASCTVELCCACAVAAGDIDDDDDERKRRRWPVSLKVSAKGGMLCGGWTEFAQDNGLGLSDACVFLPSDDGGHVFQVRLLRSTPTP